MSKSNGESLLRIRPNRKEILGLISSRLRHQKEVRLAALQAQKKAISDAHRERKKIADEAYLKSIEQRISQSEELKQLRRVAKKHGFEEVRSRLYDGKIAFAFGKKLEVELSDLDKEDEVHCELSAAEVKQLEDLQKQYDKIQSQRVDDSCIIAHLLDGSSELLQEIDAVAAKITDEFESSAVKLLEGTVE